MTAPEQQADDPRKPAWDAVFAYIGTLPREDAHLDLRVRNAMIWRAVNAALVAVGYQDENERPVPDQQAAPAGTCPTCTCDDCGGPQAEHTESGCTCKDCTPDTELACTRFLPPHRVGFLAEALGPLLSSNLHERARRRCLTVAHAAHHAMIDYDRPGAAT